MDGVLIAQVVTAMRWEAAWRNSGRGPGNILNQLVQEQRTQQRTQEELGRGVLCTQTVKEGVIGSVVGQAQGSFQQQQQHRQEQVTQIAGALQQLQSQLRQFVQSACNLTAATASVPDGSGPTRGGQESALDAGTQDEPESDQYFDELPASGPHHSGAHRFESGRYCGRGMKPCETGAPSTVAAGEVQRPAVLGDHFLERSHCEA